MKRIIYTIFCICTILSSSASEQRISIDDFGEMLTEGRIKDCNVIETSNSSIAEVTVHYTSGERQELFIAASPEAVIEQIERSHLGSWGVTVPSSLLPNLMLSILPLAVVGIAFLFWFWMLADCLRKEHPKVNDKLTWVIVVVFATLPGALLYFFIQRPKAIQ